MNRLQYVQYECIKTELKEEYEKRINYLHKRIEKRQAKQGPYQDAHLVLMQNSIAEINEMNKNVNAKNPRTGGRLSPINKKSEFALPGVKPNLRAGYSTA